MHKLNLLITGFLGSGKTTFILRSLVEKYKDKRLAIIVNDYGNISYDKVVLYREGLEVLGVEGKCICCAGIGELLETLSGIKGVDILIVETSGLSDPFTIKEALEVTGFTPHFTLCLFPGDIWKEILQDEIFLSQMESADGLIISKCDLLHPKEFEEIKAFLNYRPYFTSYEGRVDEDFFYFLEGTIPTHIKSAPKLKRALDRFSQVTLPFSGFYPMHSIESFLKSLPKSIIRAKGVLNIVESPLPMGINWTKNNLSWEPIDRPVEGFLTLVGFAGFSLPDFPKPIKFFDWSLMMPLGEFDKRKGLAYLYGQAQDEISVIEWLLEKNYDSTLLLITKESYECPFGLKDTIKIELSFENVYKLVKLLNRHIENPSLLLWDLPDAYASYIIENLQNQKREIIHVGRHFLLPRATASIRIDTKDKLEAIKRVQKQIKRDRT